MEKKVFNILTDDSKIYKQLLAFLNFGLDATTQEREVLAELIRLTHDYSALPAERRAKFILSTDMRKEVRELLDIEEKQFNTLLSRLRKKSFMGKSIFQENGAIIDELLLKPDSEGLLIGFSMKLTKPTVKKLEEKQVEQSIEEVKEDEPKKEESAIEKRMKEGATGNVSNLATPANGTDNIIEQPSNEFSLLPPDEE